MFRFLILFILFAPLAHAWTPATYEFMATDALRLAPPKLALVIEKYEEKFKQGIAAPLSSEGGELHCLHADENYGKAHQMVAHLVDESISLMAEQGNLEEVAYRMGMIAHLVADINNPLNTSRSDSLEDTYREDYFRYLERKRPKFLLSFDGYEKNYFSKMDVTAYLSRSAGRANGFYRLLGQSYYKGGMLRSSSEFDDRSTPFGIASASYSHAVSDIAKIWAYFWYKARGNMKGTLYLTVID